MSSLHIKDFRYGLDTRKSSLTQNPGTLEVLTNGFINQGGEIQNRKAFVRTARQSNTFGLQSTLAGLYTFGSEAVGSHADLNIGTGPIPIYVKYLQCVHPGVAYGGTAHAMTEVVFSTEYRGLPFVIATFGANGTFAYYDSSSSVMTLVNDFVDGQIFAWLSSNNLIADSVAAMVDRTTPYVAPNPAANVVSVTGPEGQPYGVAVTDNSAGTIASLKSSDPTPAIIAQQAVGSFTVVAGSSSAGTNKISQVEVNSVVITSAAVDWTTSNEVTAGLLATNINAYTGGTDYTAVAFGSTVQITALPGTGTTPNDYVVKVTAAGNVCIGRAQFQVTGPSFATARVYIGGVDYVGGTVAWNTSTSQTATDIAAAINAVGAGTYVANATGSIISISKKVTLSTDAPIPVYFTVATPVQGSGIYEVGLPQVNDMVAVITASGYTRTFAGGVYNYRWVITVATTGGVLPYLPAVWSGPTESIDATHANLYAYSTQAVNVPDMPAVYCTVTDSNATSVRSNTLP